MNKTKKHNSNLKITTRFALSTVLGIIIPLIIVTAFSSVFLSTIPSYFNVSTVTTNSYSLLNQIQWGQTMANISNELISEREDEQKIKNIKEIVEPLEKFGTKICIEGNGNELYSSTNKDDVLTTADNVVKLNDGKSINYFGEDGMVIVSTASQSEETYTITITNTDYTVSDVTSRYTVQDFSSLIFGKTGLMLLAIALVFIISIVILSLISSKAITKPIKKLAEGANEIANGNLDFVIDYDSTNEIGTTVKSFNHMSERLKNSIEEQNRLEISRKEMIAGVAHDLRTPLTSAKGYVEGLMDGIANTPEKQEKYLKTVYLSTCDMEKLLDELLTISRLELGKIELDKTTVNMNKFMDDCAEEIKFELEKVNFDFEYKRNCGNDVFCDIDTNRFARVVKNIVSNSIKYKREGVKGRVEMELQGYQKSVLITITDNGIGVENDSLTKIFDSFYRADKARTNVRDGSGIGLAVCKQIIELHGGHIWATSHESQGLKILISLERGQNNETK